MFLKTGPALLCTICSRVSSWLLEIALCLYTVLDQLKEVWFSNQLVDAHVIRLSTQKRCEKDSSFSNATVRDVHVVPQGGVRVFNSGVVTERPPPHVAV